MNLTEAEALALIDTKWWENRSPEDIVSFQLFEDRLCMPIELYQTCLEQVLGRDVYVHELNSPEMREEYLKERPQPSIDDIINRLPKGVMVVHRLSPRLKGE